MFWKIVYMNLDQKSSINQRLDLNCPSSYKQNFLLHQNLRDLSQTISFLVDMNSDHLRVHLCVGQYIIRSGILRWFRICSQNNIFAYAFERKSHLKKFALADWKNFDCFEFVAKFWFEIYPYVKKLQIIASRIADVLKIEHSRYL